MATKAPPANSTLIVKTLISDKYLIQNWIMFCDVLQIDPPSIWQWKMGINNGTMHFNELFRNIVHTWMSKNGAEATIQSLCDHLRNIDCFLAADRLEATFSARSSQLPTFSEWPLWFNVTKPNEQFVGRRKELAKLQSICYTCRVKRVIISGLGGIGKTELTRKFAHDSFTKRKISCTWFNGETEGTLYQSVKELALKLGIPTTRSKSPKTFAEIAEDVVSFVGVKTHSKVWLVIIDNVNELNSDLKEFFQMLSKSPDAVAILTTRNIGVIDEQMHHISLDKLGEKDAEEFFKTSLNITEENGTPEIRELCDILDNHPLAMNQAAAFILRHNKNSCGGQVIGISDYLTAFKLTAKPLLGVNLIKISSPSATATLNTWDISILRLQETHGQEGARACDILNRLAFLNPTNIQVGFIFKIIRRLLTFRDASVEGGTRAPAFHKSSDIEQELVDFEEEANIDKKMRGSIQLLKQYSLIKCDNFIVSVHRLVQQVTRIKLKFTKIDEAIISDLIQTVDIDIEKYDQNELNHVITIWNYAMRNENIIKKHSNTSIRISNQLHVLGMYSEMKQFSEAAHKKMIKISGKDHFDNLQKSGRVSRARFEIGDSVRSLEIDEELRKKEKNISVRRLQIDEELREIEKDILVRLPNLDEVDEAMKIQNQKLKLRKIEKDILVRLPNLDKLDEAMKIQNQKLKSRIQTQTQENKDVLGRIINKKCDVEGEIKNYKEVLKREEKELGSLHPSTLTTNHTLATCFYKQGKYSEAKEILEEVMESRKKVLGEDHPDTLTTMDWLAYTLRELGEFGQAVEISIQVVNSREKILGPYQPETLTSKHNLATDYYKQVNYSKAKEIFQKVVEKRKEILGEEHPSTLSSTISLALTLDKVGEKKIALEMLNELIVVQKRVFGENHPKTLKTQDYIDRITNFELKMSRFVNRCSLS